MRWLLKSLLLALVLGSACGLTYAASPKPVTPAASAVPDYGGRDSAPITAGDAAPDPVGQAGRALEALVVVLAGVVGVVYALKRFGLVTPGDAGKPARIAFPAGRGSFVSAASSAKGASPVTVVSSQTLPGGAILHVVTVADKTLLLAATGHTITTVAEWPIPLESEAETAAFEDYLSRADAAPASGVSAANARLRSLLAHSQPEEGPE